MQRRDWVLTCVGVLGLFSCGAAAEPLVCERFEGSAVGKIEGGVQFASDVVGYGGLSVPNKCSAAFDGQPGTSINYGTAKRLASPDFTVTDASGNT